MKFSPWLVCVVCVSVSTTSLAQQKNEILVCSNEAFKAMKSLPKLTYQCPADVADEYDNAILKSPTRLEAIKQTVNELQSFTESEWWAAPVSGLNACEFSDKPGPLSSEEREKLTDPENQPRLLGNSQLRLVITPDSCYQTSYNGSNAFLLYRKGQRVYVTELLNGYYSRLGNSIFLHLLGSSTAPLIRLETVNISGMRPESVNHDYVIDKATNKAIRRKASNRARAK